MLEIWGKEREDDNSSGKGSHLAEDVNSSVGGPHQLCQQGDGSQDIASQEDTHQEPGDGVDDEAGCNPWQGVADEKANESESEVMFATDNVCKATK